METQKTEGTWSERARRVREIAMNQGDSVLSAATGLPMVLELSDKANKQTYADLPFVTVSAYRNPSNAAECGILTLRFRESEVSK